MILEIFFDGAMATMIQQVSSGGVIWRQQAGRREVALILRATKKGKKLWCLPKGLVQEPESLEETARREVREETGLEGKIKEKLGQIQYIFYSQEDRNRVKKTVHFFLMDYLQGSVLDHDMEVEEARWFPMDEALAALAYETERDILKKAAQAIGP